MKKLSIAFGILATTTIPAIAPVGAKSYPTTNVRVVVPFAPGGTMDIVARIVAGRLTQQLGQNFVVDNRAGAGGTLGTDIVAKAPPTGYTLLAFHAGLAYNAAIYPKLPFDTLRDIAPISQVGSTPSLLVVNRIFKAQTTQEVLTAARAAPGSINYSSAGGGSTTHLAMELFQNLAAIKLQHIPYKGGAPAMQAVIAGETQMMVATMPGSLPHLKSGRLRALGVTSSKRSAVLPDIPTVAESGVPGYEYVTWYGVFAPSGTPGTVISQLNAAINRSLADTQVQDLMKTQGIEPVGSTPAAFATLVRGEITKWTKVIKQAGIKPDE